jgi:hypothetical protein
MASSSSGGIITKLGSSTFSALSIDRQNDAEGSGEVVQVDGLAIGLVEAHPHDDEVILVLQDLEVSAWCIAAPRRQGPERIGARAVASADSLYRMAGGEPVDA